MKPQAMNFKRYYDALRKTPGPMKKSELPDVTADYHGLVAYAKKKGVAVTELSQEEKSKYVKVNA